MNKKAINFDLDTKKLREFHQKGITQAYTDIRNFLESMGFEHRQGSGYVSKEPMRYATVDAIGKDIAAKFPSDIGVIFPILSRNRFSVLLKGIGQSERKIHLLFILNN